MADAVSDTSRWHRLGRIGSDLAVVSLLAVVIGATQASLLPVAEPARILGGLLLVFVLPGYALIAAAFPRSEPILAPSPESSSTFFGREDEDTDEARLLVRLTLSLAASVAVTSLLGVALGMAARFSTGGLAVGLGGWTLGCCLVAFGRRVTLPPDEQYAPAFVSSAAGFVGSPGQGSRLGGVVRLVVVVSLLVSMGSAAYAVSVPQQGETPTELYLLTENETGELTASGYPQNLASSQPQPLYVGVRNRERVETRFTVVVTVDRVAATGNSSVVIERSEVDRFSKTLTPNQWWRQGYTVDTPLSGSNLRLTHYLYRGDAPAEPTVEGAYRVTYLRLGDNGATEEPGGSALSSSERQRIDNGSDPTVDGGGPPDDGTTPPEDDPVPSPTDEASPSDDDPTPLDDDGAVSDDDPTSSDGDETASDDETATDDEPTSSDDDGTDSDDESTTPDGDGTDSDDESTTPDGDGTVSDDDPTSSDGDESTATDDDPTSSDGDEPTATDDDSASSADDGEQSVNGTASS